MTAAPDDAHGVHVALRRQGRRSGTRPIVKYFAWVYGVPAALYLIVAHGRPMRASQALAMFPVMELSVFVVGLLLIRSEGGWAAFWRQVGRWRVPWRWYATVLIQPALVLVVLTALRLPPGHDLLGLTFGIGAGFLEEAGWMGFAYPRLRSGHSAFGAATLLGLLWGLWHLPVVDFLGAAAPHGAYWLPFLLAFIAVVTAVRITIAWVYAATGSLLLPMLIHAGLTASLAVLAPTGVTPGQETFWYALFAVMLWIVAARVRREMS